nr:MAG TPA: hypothetical protein [Caudoviricetes sp.]
MMIRMYRVCSYRINNGELQDNYLLSPFTNILY